MMKRHGLIGAAALAAAVSIGAARAAFATDYVWSGAAGDGKWTTPGNWTVGSAAATACPNAAADTANFGIAATVDVDDAVAVSNVSVTAAVTVTLNRSGEGSVNFTATDINVHGYSVATGSKLVINVPTVSNGRFDLSGGGTIEWNDTFTRSLAKRCYFYCDRLDMGSGFLHVGSGSGSADETISFGMGYSTGGKPFAFNLLGSAKINLYDMPFRTIAGSSWSYGLNFTQDGAETMVTNTAGDFYVHYTSRETARTFWYKLKSGTIDIAGNLYAGHLPEGEKIGTGGDYIQEGGNATFHGQLVPRTGDIRLCGGTLTTDGGVTVPAAGTGSFRMEGGVFNLHGTVDSAFTVSGGVLRPSAVTINRTVTMTGGALDPGAGVTFGADGRIVLSGDAKVLVANDCTWTELSSALAACGIGSDVAFTADHAVTVTFPAGCTVADFNGDGNIAVAVADGATVPDGVTLRAGAFAAAGADGLGGRANLVYVAGTPAYADMAALNPKSVELDGANFTYAASDVIAFPIVLTRTVFSVDTNLQFGANGKYIYNGGSVRVAGTLSFAKLMAALKETMNGEGDRFGLVTDTSATLTVAESRSLPEALEIGSNVTVSVAANVQLTAATDTVPALTVRNGGKFDLRNQTAYLATPVELTLDAGSALTVDAGYPSTGTDYARTMIVARSFVLKGVAQERGRYAATQTGEFRCLFNSSNAQNNFIYVPYVWTGAGDGKTLGDTGNWEDGAWSADGADVICDFSAATNAIELAADATLGGVAYLPPATCDGSTLNFVNAAAGDHTLSLRGNSLQERYVCRQGCTVDFAVDVLNSDAAIRVFFGGEGTWVFSRSLDQNGVDNFLCLGGAAEIAGTLATAGNLQFCEMYNSQGYLRFVDGADVSLAGYITLDHANSWTSGHGFRQTGGSVTAKGVIMTVAKRKNAGNDNNTYKLEGGTLTLTEQLAIGSAHPLWPEEAVSRGGVFQMTGGTLATPVVNNEFNLSVCRLYGGDVYLGAGGFAKTATSHYSSSVQTEAPLTLGAVTLHATNGSWSVDSALRVDFLGGTVFDVAAGNTVTVACPVTNVVGGIVKRGAGALVFGGAYDTAGDIVMTDGSLAFADNADLAVDRVEVHDLQQLSLKAGTTLTVRYLKVNGVYRPDGDYALGSGRIVVSGAPAVWTDATGDHRWGTAGNWRDLALPTAATPVLFTAGATVELDSAAVSGGLILDAGSLRFEGTGSLEFAGPAEMSVPADSTVTFTTNVTAYVRTLLVKEGPGKVLFEGALANALGAKAVSWPSLGSTNEFKVAAGEAEFRGDVSGLRVHPCSDDADAVAKVTIGEGATFTNKCVVQGPWAGYYGTGYGEVTMNGGLVDLNSGVKAFTHWGRSVETNFVYSKYGFSFFQTGSCRITVNGGRFVGPADTDVDSCFNIRNVNAGGGGVTTITVNGGELLLRNSLHFGLQDNADDTLTLNGGRFSVGQLSVSSGAGPKTVRLNGGEFLAAAMSGTKSCEGDVVCGIDECLWTKDSEGEWVRTPRRFNPIEIGGDVHFTQEDASVTFEIGPVVDFRYGGETLINDGPGAVALRYAPEGEFAVRVAKSGAFRLDFDGVKEVRSVSRGRSLKPAGDYCIGGLYPENFPGGGVFRALAGRPEPGHAIFIR